MTDWSPGVYPETRQAKPPDLRSAQDKTTSWTGHFLAGHEALDEREAAVGLGLLRIRRRQLDEAVQQRLFGTVEVARPRPEVQSTTPDLDSVVKDRVIDPVGAACGARGISGGRGWSWCRRDRALKTREAGQGRDRRTLPHGPGSSRWARPCMARAGDGIWRKYWTSTTDAAPVDCLENRRSSYTAWSLMAAGRFD